MIGRFQPQLVFAYLVAVVLSGCQGERTVTAKTSVARVEINTKMPRGALSDQQLQAAADEAAHLASTQTVPLTGAPTGQADIPSTNAKVKVAPKP